MKVYIIVTYDASTYQIVKVVKYIAVSNSERKAHIERNYATNNPLKSGQSVLAILDSVAHNYIKKLGSEYWLDKQMLDAYPLNKGRLPDWMYKPSDIECPNCNYIFPDHKKYRSKKK